LFNPESSKTLYYSNIDEYSAKLIIVDELKYPVFDLFVGLIRSVKNPIVTPD
jgi:hypothetical protein